MLHALICFKTSGHTLAWQALYSSTQSGFRRTICAMRFPWFFSFGLLRLVATGVFGVGEDAGRVQSFDMLACCC